MIPNGFGGEVLVSEYPGRTVHEQEGPLGGLGCGHLPGAEGLAVMTA